MPEQNWNPTDHATKFKRWDKDTQSHKITLYLPVWAKKHWFRLDHPNGLIRTYRQDDFMLAEVHVRDEEWNTHLVSTGHATVTPFDQGGKSKAVEKAETLAVGRALSLAGYDIDGDGSDFDDLADVDDADSASTIREHMLGNTLVKWLRDNYAKQSKKDKRKPHDGWVKKKLAELGNDPVKLPVLFNSIDPQLTTVSGSPPAAFRTFADWVNSATSTKQLIQELDSIQNLQKPNAKPKNNDNQPNKGAVKKKIRDIFNTIKKEKWVSEMGIDSTLSYTESENVDAYQMTFETLGDEDVVVNVAQFAGFKSVKQINDISIVEAEAIRQWMNTNNWEMDLEIING